MKGLLQWLHDNVDENVKGDAYDYNWYSDGSSSWQYRSKNYKWEITKSMDQVVFHLDDEYETVFKLRWT
jgi:hypothetical protein